MALNARQQAFVESYTGNATDAARKAGYTGTDEALAVTGSRLLRNPKVREALEARQARATKRRIATLDEMQAWWTASMEDTTLEMPARLKASELLGRSMAAFIERRQVESKTLEAMLAEMEANNREDREDREPPEED